MTLLPLDPADTPVPITRAMRKELRFHWKRSGVPTSRVLESNPPIPEGLTIGMVNRWIANRLHIARPSHWNFVLTHWSQLPNGENYKKRLTAPKGKIGRPNHIPELPRIPLTEQMAQEFWNEIIRTGADWQRDILSAPDAPDRLSYRVLIIWKYRQAKTARKDHWEFVMARLAAMPDFESAFSAQTRNRT